MSTKKQITVGVTGLNAIDSPGPGIPVIRGLKESEVYDVRIIGLSYEALEPGIYMHDLVDKTYQIPFPSSGIDSLLTRLQHIHAIEKIDLIIPNFDAELFSFIKLADHFENVMGIKMFVPTQEQFDERHKANLNKFGDQHGIKVPMSKMIFSTAEIPELQEEFGYPMVIKGKFYDASIAYTPEQAANHFNKISAKWGLPIIVQKFVHGQEVNVTALGDGKGTTMGAVAMRKTFITDKGKAWAGIAIKDEKLMDMTTSMISSTKWRGGLELEIMKTSEGDYYLIEINPRFPAWVYLAVGCGQNHPDALMRLAMGDEVKPFTDYDAGKMFIRYSYDMIVNLDEFEKISTAGEL
jgi:carbamoyl-phosphate synthase large subunit